MKIMYFTVNKNIGNQNNKTSFVVSDINLQQ